MRVLFFVYHFHPSPEIGAKRPSEMARRFLLDGRSVDVIHAGTVGPSDARDAGGTQYCSQRRGVPVPPNFVSEAWRFIKRRILRSGYSKPGSGPDTAVSGHSSEPKPPQRPVRRFPVRWYLSMESLFGGLKLWTAACVFPVLSAIRKNAYDVVVTSAPPMNTALVIWMLRLAPVRRFRWILDLRDPFVTPPSPESSSALRSFLEAAAERACFRSCDVIVVASPGLKADIERRHPDFSAKVHVVYNGYDGQPSFEPPYPPPGPLRLLAAGTIYLNRDPRPLLDAVAIARSKLRSSAEPFRVTILGRCEYPTESELREWISRRSLADAVDVVGAVPPDEVSRYVDDSHVLINFAQGQKMMIPAKTYEYMASGKETLTITEPDSDTAEVVRRAQCGPISLPVAEELSEALLALHDKYIVRGTRHVPQDQAVEQFARSRQLEILLSIAGSM